MRRSLVIPLLLAVLAPLQQGCGVLDFARGYTTTSSRSLPAALQSAGSPAEVGAARFLHDDFGSLNTDAMETNAVPWKLVAAALSLDEAERSGRPLGPELLVPTFTSFGFLIPDSILNLPGGPAAVALDRPLGVVAGELRRTLPRLTLEVANLGCAACHAGATYDRDGSPRRQVWLGLPNTSIDFEAYTDAVYRALKRWTPQHGRLMAAMDALFPRLDPEERRTIERFVLPRVEKRLQALTRHGDTALPFHNGGPGFTNGVAALKMQLGVLPAGARDLETGYVSIPELGGRLARTSLLVDGTYAIPGHARFAPSAGEKIPELARIVSFFTVPTMGMKPGLARRAAPRVEEVLQYLRTYEPPPFPGAIDPAAAARGEALYRLRCASCHGTVEADRDRMRLTSYPNRLVPQAEIGTDPVRWQAIDDRLLGAVHRTRFASVLDAARTGGYVAPPLSGVWATAPYLHNGSVPTLWHLLHPRARPERFFVGGHRLDFERVGIAGELDSTGTWQYPAGYRPWSRPALYDTRRHGQSASGHASEFEPLSEDERRSLIEFLKRL